MVKPDSARMVSEHILMLAQSGKLRSKVDGSQLVKLLEQVQESTAPAKIKFQRKGEEDQILGQRSSKKQVDSDDSDNFDTSSDEEEDREED
jgi:hypothetical protein